MKGRRSRWLGPGPGGYPEVMQGWGDDKAPVTVDDTEWVSQADAWDALGGNTNIGTLIANGHLRAAENGLRHRGVTRESLEAEKQWRQSASVMSKVGRLLRDLVNWISF